MKSRAIMVVAYDWLLHELRFRGNFHGEEKLAVSSRPDDEEKSSEDGEAEEEKKRRRREEKRRQENKSPVSSSKRKTCQRHSDSKEMWNSMRRLLRGAPQR